MIGTTLYIALLTVALGVSQERGYKVTNKKLPVCETIMKNQSYGEIGSPHLELEQSKVRREWLYLHSSFGGCSWVKTLYWLLTTEFYEVEPKDDHQLHSRKEKPDT